jgi:ribosomal protein RSM22 (predicted rRNA methylase)
MLPDKIVKKIEELLEGKSLSKIAETVKDLSGLYRQKTIKKSYMEDEKDYLAYLLFRLPATFKAVCSVLKTLKDVSQEEIKTVLDIGSGPGTATLAALEVLDISKAHLIEKEKGLLDIASSFIDHLDVEYKNTDFQSLPLFPSSDVAIFSYSIGEVVDWKNTLERVLSSCQTIVIVEPGTPKGFNRIREIRSYLIENGLFVLAPCPHCYLCPVKEGAWCHFSVRLARTKWHKDVKGGELGFEDEKFSYVIASKKPGKSFNNRIVSSPKHLKGHMIFEVCNKQGVIEEITVSKKQKDFYKSAKKKEWGDDLEVTEP